MPYKNPADQAKWRKLHPNAARDYNLQRNYGISSEQFAAMAQSQGWRCRICRQVPIGKRNQAVLHVDHNHKTGEIRGLLCSNCNRGLGLFRDDPTLLRQAAQYLNDGKEASRVESL